MDISNELTVFHITCRDINYQKSLTALKNQTVNFRLETIEDVTPLHKACQQMLDQCKTPYFIQVDEDMILQKDAVETMYNEIKETPEDIMFLTFGLYDDHVDRKIQAVKVYKYNIMKNYPYKNSISTEVSQFKEAEKDGYQWEAKRPTLGEHSPEWTPYSAYQRYRALFEKRRKIGHLGWITGLPEKFLSRYVKEEKGEDLWALLGIIAGLTSELENSERDHDTYGREDFQRLEKFFS